MNFPILEKLPQSTLHIVNHVYVLINRLVESNTSIESFVERGLVLLALSAIPSRYHSFTFKTTIFLIYWMTHILCNLNPFQTFFRVALDYSTLCIFGCLCFSYLHSDNLHKMDSHSSPSVFIGNPISFSDYRYLDLNSDWILISHITYFDETVLPLYVYVFLHDLSSRFCALGSMPLIPSFL